MPVNASFGQLCFVETVKKKKNGVVVAGQFKRILSDYLGSRENISKTLIPNFC